MSSPNVPGWLDDAAQVAWRVLVIAAAVGVALYVAGVLYLVAIPFLVACIIASVTTPFARRLERFGLGRTLSSFTAVIGSVTVICAGFALLAPRLIRQSRELAPTFAAGLDELVGHLEGLPFGLTRDEIVETTKDALRRVDVSDVAVAFGELAAATLLAVVLAFFLTKDGPAIRSWLVARSPAAMANTLHAVLDRTAAALGGFVRATALVAAIDAVGIGLGLWILDVPLVLPLMLLVFIGGFVPVLGAVVTGAVAVIVAFAANGPTTALWVAVVVLVVQQAESNVLQPVIMRRAVSLHPIVILCVLAGGALTGGVIGALIAVPVAAAIAAGGNELRLRTEASRRGETVGPEPLGGRWATARQADPNDRPDPVT